jgi:hypothetical protein
MSSHARKRAQRRSDFRQRADAAPAGVISVPERGWQYIPVHPMADEARLLESLGMTPEDCTAVDCYWAARTDVVFLQIVTRDRVAGNPGLYARRSEKRPYMVYLSAVVDQKYITRAVVEAVMSGFSRFGVHRKKSRGFGKRDRRLASTPPLPLR